ncbi:Ig-like domain-containing protein [Brevibacillus thermoruber]|uniref:Ig-like domain-containing protein n=1 Tax=Brevibacillus thermoruber TaxID=33942 RepID=UPI0040420BFA
MTSITTPVTVVAQLYYTSGNGGRKLVRLSNGWLVAGAIDISTGKAHFYKSTDNGSTWNQICFITPVAASIKDLALVANGTSVKALYSLDSVNANADGIALSIFDPTNQSDADIYSSRITVDSGQLAVDKVSLDIAPDGTLHAAWIAKSPSYSNSFNIRYSKSTNGGQTWGAPAQLTMFNTTTDNVKSVCVAVRPDGNPVVVFEFNTSTTYYSIRSISYNGSSWGSQVYVYPTYNQQYQQSSPSAVVDNAGGIHVVWYGTDAADSSAYNIRYSKSTDDGTTWSTATKLTSGNTLQNTYPSLTVDRTNKLFVVFQRGNNNSTNSYNIALMSNGGEGWSGITQLTDYSGSQSDAVYPSTLLDKSLWFSEPPMIYTDQVLNAVKFCGTWTTNQNPTLTLTSPTDNQTLSEGNQFLVEGSVSDVDYGDVITIKYKINNGTERALYSAVSDGSNPINFSKALIFSGDRLYDGAVDVSGSLAEGVNHTLSVWAVDNQGGQSVLLTRTFTVHHNQGAIITVDPYTPTQAGLIEPDMIALSGSAFDPDNNTITVTGKINNATEEVLLSAVTSGNWTFSFPVSSLKTGDNTITIKATDQFGKETLKTFKINKTEQKTPLLQSVARYKIIPPLGTAKEILAWLKREKGDLDVETEASFTDAGQPETYVPAVKSSVDLSHDIAEDEFVVSVDTAKPEIVLKQTFTRTDTNSTQAATSLVGVIS